MTMITTRFVFILVLLVSIRPLLAADTRAERLKQQRLAKANTLKPPERSSLEKGLYKAKEDRLLERYQAGYKGFHLMVGGMNTGSGFALGTLYRKDRIFDTPLSFSASAQASLSRYQKYTMAVEAPDLAGRRMFASFNFGYRNFPQEDFYGIGSDSKEENRVNYSLEDTNYNLTVGVRPARSLAIGTRIGLLNNHTGPGTDIRFPSIERVFDVVAFPGLYIQPDYSYVGAFAAYDTRSEPLNPRSGGLYRVETTHFDDRDFSQYSFQGWKIEAQQYFPFFNERRVIAARARLQLTDTHPGQQVPFFLLPALGGSEDLRGFSELRFRDKQALVMNLEYRWEAFSGLDLALFGDAGNVFHGIRDITLHNLHTSYGVGARVNTKKSVFLRIDVGFGREGPQTFFKFGHVF